MTPEELLIPRYKVIADYPGNEIKVGKVFEPNTDWPESYLKKYPHLFRKLEWWEERELGDMPGYVKWVEYMPINKQKLLPERGMIELAKSIMWGNSIRFEVQSQINIISAEYFLPSTETEYLKYKSKQP